MRVFQGGCISGKNLKLKVHVQAFESSEYLEIKRRQDGFVDVQRTSLHHELNHVCMMPGGLIQGGVQMR